MKLRNQSGEKSIASSNIFVVFTLVMLFSILPAVAAERVFFYHTDATGTPIAMTDASGTVVWQADYMPFGQEHTVSGSVENKNKFIGKEKDEETDLYYFGARYLDARSGRFIKPDPVGITESDLLNPQRFNRYNYSLNNPYRYIDPDGRWPEEVHNTIINRAFSRDGYTLSSAAISAMQRGSKEADSFKFQGPAYSYIHAMRAKGQNAEVAAGQTVTFIMQKVNEYKFLIKEGKTNQAYEALGMAMHPLMDNTSPSHEDYQEWSGILPITDGTTKKAFEHARGEREKVFNSDPAYLRKSVDAIRRLYDEANR